MHETRGNAIPVGCPNGLDRIPLRSLFRTLVLLYLFVKYSEYLQDPGYMLEGLCKVNGLCGRYPRLTTSAYSSRGNANLDHLLSRVKMGHLFLFSLLTYQINLFDCLDPIVFAMGYLARSSFDITSCQCWLRYSFHSL